MLLIRLLHSFIMWGMLQESAIAFPLLTSQTPFLIPTCSNYWQPQIRRFFAITPGPNTINKNNNNNVKKQPSLTFNEKDGPNKEIGNKVSLEVQPITEPDKINKEDVLNRVQNLVYLNQVPYVGDSLGYLTTLDIVEPDFGTPEEFMAESEINTKPLNRRYLVGSLINSIPWLPLEVNVPDTISWVWNGFSSIIGGIGQRLPFSNRRADEPRIPEFSETMITLVPISGTVKQKFV